LALYPKLQPDVTLLDLRLSRMTGLSTLRALRRDHINAKVIVLTMYDNEEDVYQALSGGAAAYLVKDTVPDALVSTIRDVQVGRRPIGPMIRARVSERNTHMPLTSREIEVLTLVSYGKRNKEIAEELLITQQTVIAHLRNIYGKLGVNDRT